MFCLQRRLCSASISSSSLLFRSFATVSASPAQNSSKPQLSIAAAAKLAGRPKLKLAPIPPPAPIVTFKANVRFHSGKYVCRRLRKQARIPGIIFNRTTGKRILIDVDAIQLSNEIHRNRSFTNRVYKVELPGLKEPISVIPTEFKQHLVDGYLLSFMFAEYEVGKPIRVRIPVYISGADAAEITLKGGLIEPRAEWIDCIWDGHSENIPECIIYHAVEAPADTRVYAKDLNIPKGLTLIEPMTTILRTYLNAISDDFMNPGASLVDIEEEEEDASKKTTTAASGTAAAGDKAAGGQAAAKK